MSCYRKVIYTGFYIGLRHADGGIEEHFVNEISRRFALSRAFNGRKGLKVAFCKTQDEMTDDELGRMDLPLSLEGRIAERELEQRRISNFWHNADQY